MMLPSNRSNRMHRRHFLRLFLAGAASLVAAPFLKACQRLGLIETEATPLPLPEVIVRTPAPSLTPFSPSEAASPTPAPTEESGASRVAFVRTRDRAAGVRAAIDLLGLKSFSDQDVLLKPNFNSADPPPASTHLETLRSLVGWLQEAGASRITVADRSGMGNTRTVLDKLGVFDLGRELGFDVLAFDDLAGQDWDLVDIQGSHWRRGFPVARQVFAADAIVQTCCLKPHRFGGHFTLSLKNSVGMVGKFIGRSGHNYMSELHNSPDQRLMIAEINAVYQPALVVLDGVEAFIDDGPERGSHAWGEVVLAGTDRVALDVVGLALLRYLGYSGVASRGPVFAQQQIARSVELGLGVERPEKIRFLTPDAESEAYAAVIRDQLLQSG